MFRQMKDDLQQELAHLRQAGLLKEERRIHGPQGAEVAVEYPPGAPLREVINFCANNYLGLSAQPEVVRAAREGLERRGYGLSSVRFICGTQDIHKELEAKLSSFLGRPDAILLTSCFDANLGLFEALFSESDALITDQLNHASIIDGVRLCKARRLIYRHLDLADLEEKLRETDRARHRAIVTDGVFSMDGEIAPLQGICDLAERYDALVVVDDSHATGFVGRTGRGTAELCGVQGRVDVITTTLGKALGGASGGCIAGPTEIVNMLRQRARPYVFSNTIPPVVVAAALKAIDMISVSTVLRDRLEANTRRFREKMTAAGIDIKPGVHPIVPIMLYNARLAQDFARDLYDAGVYVIGFCFPVVPRGQARIRVQLSAAHTPVQIDRAVEAFAAVGRKYEVVGCHREQIIARYGE